MEGKSTLRWGVLGAARIATRHVIPATQQADRCEVVAIASRQIERAEATAAELGIPRAYGSYEEMLAADDIDAVYIPLPNHLHAEWTMAAAEAGKHVLCEKPLALTASQAQDMADACRKAGVKLMEAFMYRMHPQWVRVRRLVASGGLGKLEAVQSWFSYRNHDPADIRNVVAFGGGGLMDIGCYCINLSRMLFHAEPTRVQGAVVRHPDSGVDIVASGILEFPSGIASFTCATQMEGDQRVHIVGSEGRLSVEIPFNTPPDRTMHLYLTTGGWSPGDPNTETISIPAANQYTVQAEQFARTVLDGAPIPVPPDDSVANMRVIEAVLASAEG